MSAVGLFDNHCGWKRRTGTNTEGALKELIGKMDDQDEDVRKQVVTQLNQKNLGAQYVPSFAKQLTSSTWSVRNDAAKFLGKINADSAIVTLIGGMDDQDEDVHKTIVQQLQDKQLKDSHVAPLSEQYKSQNWSVRRDVSVLLGKIVGLNATNALIKQMDDQEEDVRNTIVVQLSARSLANDSVPSLRKNFSSQNWSVRRDVAKLLGKIKSPSSLDALQDQLTKESDDDVKNQIIASIEAVKG
jgi:HEAT repeat protein